MLVRLTQSAMSGALALALVQTAAAAEDRLLRGLDSRIEQIRADWKNVGTGVAVVHGGKIIYARGFGVREHGKSAAVDANTLFQVGSTSKAFTTAALAILVEEGKIGWDDPVRAHLPGFELNDPWLTEHLTVRDTVTHRSGIADVRYYVMAVMNSDAVLEQLRHIPAEAPFRDSYRYSNLMYGLAGKLVESASGMTWHEFVKRRILRPLGMARSGTTAYDFWDARHVAPTFLGSAPAGTPAFSDARDSNLAMPHGWDESGSIVVLPWQSFDNAAAAGTIVSSAGEMAKWLLMHLNGGQVDGRQFLKKETVRELHTTQNLRPRDKQFSLDRMEERYALGWRSGQFRGHTHLSHGGGIVGFPAYVAMLPDRKVGVVVLSNGPRISRGDSYAMHRAITSTIFDRVLGEAPQDWSKAFLGRHEAEEREAQRKEEELLRSRLRDAPPSLPLEQYAGIYEDQVLRSGPVTLQAQNGRLILRFAGEGAFSASLEHWHRDLFRLHSDAGVAAVTEYVDPQFIAFILDPAGQVVSMSAFGSTFRRLPASQ